jgi:hypothetical protein
MSRAAAIGCTRTQGHAVATPFSVGAIGTLRFKLRIAEITFEIGKTQGFSSF